MTRPFLLMTLALVTGCGPKMDPKPTIEPLGESPVPELVQPTEHTPLTSSEGTTEPDGGAFRWSAELGTLELEDDLAGRSLHHRTNGHWESRSTFLNGHGRAADYGGGLGISVEGGGGAIGRAARPTPRSGSALAKKSRPVMEAVADSYAAPPPSMDAAASGMPMAESAAIAHPSSPVRPMPAPSLKAGTTDDNQNFDAWLSYVSERGARRDISRWADRLDVNGRRQLQVLDARGRPVPDAQVSVIDPTDERVVWAGRAYGDGRVPMYPQLKVPGRTLDIAGDAPEGGWLVQATTADGAMRTVRWDGQSDELDIILDSDGLKVGAPVPVDVCFIIDTTGSMGDEIDRIKTTLLSVTDKLRSDASQGVDLRYGAVLYRDIGDEYVTRRHAFTGDLEGFDGALQTITAGGGGDGPESLNQGLAVGVAGMDWREGAARVAFVIADAPPHMDYQEDVSYGRAAAAAAHRGIRVHTVAASGLNDRGSFAFRQIAQLTRGQFIYIEYGSAAASAADHGVSVPAGSNNLDDILYGRIRAEIDGWGKDGTEKVARR